MATARGRREHERGAKNTLNLAATNLSAPGNKKKWGETVNLLAPLSRGAARAIGTVHGEDAHGHLGVLWGLPGVLCTLQSSRGKEGEGTLRAEQRDAGEEREELFLLEWTAESKMFLYHF